MYMRMKNQAQTKAKPVPVITARMTVDQIQHKCCNATLERLARLKTRKGDLCKS
ncbi:hypothetical protein HYC85_030834 [Camellia sinensis]|uniref:Uncharacterized protein n=1 Tax=Camellia sinensis TaxID=4442 RepID=A0A7J7G1S4_CAMSI|nr:hypothetical protein HYC85_030834 [Camellia sinensis]